MRFATTALGLAFAAFLASAAPSQSTTTLLLEPRTVSWTWPSIYAAGAFQRMVRGDFNDDGATDIGLLRNRTSYTQFNAETGGWFVPFGSLTDIDDIAALDGNPGDPERLLAAHGGLSIGSYSPAPGFEWTAVTATGWDTVNRLRAQWFATGQHLVIGVTANKRQVRIGRLLGTGMSTLGTIDTAVDIVDVVLANTHGNAVPEVIVLTTTELRYHQVTSALIGTTQLVTATNRGFITPLARATLANDLIAWLTPRVGGWKIRVEAGPGITVSSKNLQLGFGIPDQSVVSGIDAADTTGDAHDDVLVSIDDGTGANHYVALLRQNAAQAAFAQDYVIPVAGAAGGNNCPGLLADWNHDGIAEAVVARDTGNAVELHFNLQAAILRADNIEGSGLDDLPEILRDPLTLTNTIPAGEDIQLRLEIPPDLRNEATHLAVTVFACDVPPSHSGIVFNPNAEATYVGALPQGDRVLAHVPLEKNPIPLHHYFLLVRLLDAASPNAHAQTSPTWLYGHTFGFTSREAAMVYYLRDISDPPFENEYTLHQNGNKQVGAVKSRNVRPPVPVGQAPGPGPLRSLTLDQW